MCSANQFPGEEPARGGVISLLVFAVCALIIALLNLLFIGFTPGDADMAFLSAILQVVGFFLLVVAGSVGSCACCCTGPIKSRRYNILAVSAVGLLVAIIGASVFQPPITCFKNTSGDIVDVCYTVFDTTCDFDVESEWNDDKTGVDGQYCLSSNIFGTSCSEDFWATVFEIGARDKDSDDDDDFWGFKNEDDCNAFVRFGTDDWALFRGMIWGPTGAMMLVGGIAMYLVATIPAEASTGAGTGGFEMK